MKKKCKKGVQKMYRAGGGLRNPPFIYVRHYTHCAKAQSGTPIYWCNSIITLLRLVPITLFYNVIHPYIFCKKM